MAPQSDKRRPKLKDPALKHEIALALLERAKEWGVSPKNGGYARTIANECGVTYEQVRTVRSNLLALGA